MSPAQILRVRPRWLSTVRHALPIIKPPTHTTLTMQIMAAANSGNFPACFQVAAKMKTVGITPDISTYNALMSAVAQDANALFSWAILDDMLLVGVQPTTTTFTHLMDVTITPFLFQLSLLMGISRHNVDVLLSICGTHGTK